MLHRIARFLAPAVLASAALAQGDDNCATAQIVAGTGLFPFSNVGMTTDGVGDPLCLAFSNNQIYSDVWFSWVAPTTAAYVFSTCGQTTLDTKLAIYDTACGGAILACSDDDCGGPLQSSITLGVTTGSTYLIRLGSFSTTLQGSGNLSIALFTGLPILQTAVNPANGNTYHRLQGSSWSAAQQTAVLLGGNLVTIGDQAEHDWVLANFHTLNVTDLWTGFNDVNVEGSFEWVSGQPVTFTNWDGNEPNDGAGGEDFCAMRKNNPAALWNDLADAPTGYHANPHGIVEIESVVNSLAFCAGDGTLADHTTPCPCGNDATTPGNGCGHSFDPGGANLAASGNPANDDVVLTTSLTPSTSFTLFMQHDAAGDAIFHDGVLCAAGTLIRLRGRQAGIAGQPGPGQASFPNTNFPNDTMTLSQRGQVVVGSGAVRYYAGWYRNASTSFCPPATANVTNGWVITW